MKCIQQIKNTIRNTSGVTLMELLLTVAILGSLTLASTSFYSRFVTQNNVSNVQDQFVNSLRKAQMYAMMGKENSAWGVNYSSNTITLFKGSSFAGHDTAFDEKFTVSNSVSVSGFSTVIFAKRTGLPIPTSLSVTISGSGSTKTFSMNSHGVINR